jgi:uncharacterized protein (TIGR00251 family)
VIELTERPDGTVLAVRAQPGAKRNAVVGERAGALRVAVSAAPERGKANAAIQEVLADALGCKASRVLLVSGETSRDKRFMIQAMTRDELARRLRGLLGPEESQAVFAPKRPAT